MQHLEHRIPGPAEYSVSLGELVELSTNSLEGSISVSGLPGAMHRRLCLQQLHLRQQLRLQQLHRPPHRQRRHQHLVLRCLRCQISRRSVEMLEVRVAVLVQVQEQGSQTTRALWRLWSSWRTHSGRLHRTLVLGAGILF